jgi:hypothetical protein
VRPVRLEDVRLVGGVAVGVRLDTLDGASTGLGEGRVLDLRGRVAGECGLVSAGVSRPACVAGLGPDHLELLVDVDRHVCPVRLQDVRLVGGVAVGVRLDTLDGASTGLGEGRLLDLRGRVAGECGLVASPGVAVPVRDGARDRRTAERDCREGGDAHDELPNAVLHADPFCRWRTAAQDRAGA